MDGQNRERFQCPLDDRVLYLFGQQEWSGIDSKNPRDLMRKFDWFLWFVYLPVSVGTSAGVWWIADGLMGSLWLFVMLYGWYINWRNQRFYKGEKTTVYFDLDKETPRWIVVRSDHRWIDVMVRIDVVLLCIIAVLLGLVLQRLAEIG